MVQGDRFLGCRVNGILAGTAMWSYVDELDLAFLKEIFVSPAFCKMGVGKALVLAAIKNLSGNDWVYQAVRDNLPSIALAKSCGFKFAGAALWLM